MSLDVIKDKSILVIEADLDSRIKIKAIFDFIEYGSLTFSSAIEENPLKEDPYFVVVAYHDDESELLFQIVLQKLK